MQPLSPNQQPQADLGLIPSLFRTFRPRQWVKSGFVLAPALFTLDILQSEVWGKLLAAVVGFSLVASAVYTFNDLLNREGDRLHPVKRFRPIAAGSLGVTAALTAGGLALAAGLGWLYFASPTAALAGIGYTLLMIAYSLFLRKLLIVDILVVASGFVLRVQAGAFAISEPVSHWLSLCTFTIALFLGLIKRRQEIVALESGGALARSVLTHYPPLNILDGWITAVMAMTMLCYSLYTVDPQTVAKHHTQALIYTVPFVLYGVFRYQKLALEGREGEDPTELVLKDTGIKVVVVLWAIIVAAILWVAKR